MYRSIFYFYFFLLLYFCLISHLLVTKTHLYGLTQRANRKNGIVEVTVRQPLSSVIKIATKSSFPEIISFTYGEKILKSSTNSASSSTALVATAVAAATEEATPRKSEDSTLSDKDAENGISTAAAVSNNDYIIKGKDWFYVPDYAGEAASAVKLQILQIIELISQ
jgi:hypothetical protein